VIKGEVRFEVEGEPPRIVKAGEAFWEPAFLTFCSSSICFA
jgi:quercetin dioxygenase-like cupin family protein